MQERAAHGKLHKSCTRYFIRMSVDVRYRSARVSFLGAGATPGAKNCAENNSRFFLGVQARGRAPARTFALVTELF